MLSINNSELFKFNVFCIKFTVLRFVVYGKLAGQLVVGTAELSRTLHSLGDLEFP